MNRISQLTSKLCIAGQRSHVALFKQGRPAIVLTQARLMGDKNMKPKAGKSKGGKPDTSPKVAAGTDSKAAAAKGGGAETAKGAKDAPKKK